MNTRCGITILVMLLSIDRTTRRKRGRYRASFHGSIEVFFHMAFFPFFTLCKLKAMKRGKLMCNGKVFASFTSPSSKKLQHQYCVYISCGRFGRLRTICCYVWGLCLLYLLFKTIECPEAADMGKFNQFISCQDIFICCCWKSYGWIDKMNSFKIKVWILTSHT